MKNSMKQFPGWLSRLAQALVIAVVVSVSLAATDPMVRFEALGRKLMCPCGCAEMMLECNHVGCPDSGPMRDEISQKIAGGVSDAAILDGFVQRYGATVLAAPTTEGFNLVAWIMPFAVAGLALFGTIMLVRNWAKHQPKLAPVKQTQAQMIADELMRERIRRETGIDSGIGGGVQP